MTNIALELVINSGGDREMAPEPNPRRVIALFGALSGAPLHPQDAPRAPIANNCLLAMTRFANPNRLNNCASFLARSL